MQTELFPTKMITLNQLLQQPELSNGTPFNHQACALYGQVCDLITLANDNLLNAHDWQAVLSAGNAAQAAAESMVAQELAHASKIIDSTSLLASTDIDKVDRDKIERLVEQHHKPLCYWLRFNHRTQHWQVQQLVSAQRVIEGLMYQDYCADHNLLNVYFDYRYRDAEQFQRDWQALVDTDWLWTPEVVGVDE